MDKGTLQSGIEKLVLMTEQAGFTVEQMIELLNSGVGMLIELISWRLEGLGHPYSSANVQRQYAEDAKVETYFAPYGISPCRVTVRIAFVAER
jgi:hypothetical protein